MLRGYWIAHVDGFDAVSCKQYIAANTSASAKLRLTAAPSDLVIIEDHDVPQPGSGPAAGN